MTEAELSRRAAELDHRIRTLSLELAEVERLKDLLLKGIERNSRKDGWAYDLAYGRVTDLSRESPKLRRRAALAYGGSRSALSQTYALHGVFLRVRRDDHGIWSCRQYQEDIWAIP